MPVWSHAHAQHNSECRAVLYMHDFYSLQHPLLHILPPSASSSSLTRSEMFRMVCEGPLGGGGVGIFLEQSPSWQSSVWGCRKERGLQEGWKYMTWHDVKEVLRSGGRFKAWDGVASSYTWTSNTFWLAMTKAAREWMLCATEQRNTELAVYSLVAWRKGLVLSGVGKHPCNTSSNFGKTKMCNSEWKWTLGKLRSRRTLNRVCLRGCISDFCILHLTVWYIHITCPRVQLLQLLPWSWMQQIDWESFFFSCSRQRSHAPLWHGVHKFWRFVDRTSQNIFLSI